MEKPAVELWTEGRVEIEMRIVPEEQDVVKSGYVISSFVGGKLLARRQTEDGILPSWNARINARIVYAASEQADRSIQGYLFAYLPDDFEDVEERETWYSSQIDPEHFGCLGCVVRVAKDRKFNELEAECVDHFQALLAGQGVPIIDKLVEDL